MSGLKYQLGRRWWVIAALALVGGLAALVLGSTSYQASSDVTAVASNAALESTGLKGDLLSGQLAIMQDATAIQGHDYLTALRGNYGSDVELEVRLINNNTTVQVVVTADDAATVRSALDSALSTLIGARRERYQHVLDSVISDRRNAVSSLQAQIGAIDQQLTGASQQDTSLTSALQANRAALESSIATAKQQIATLQEVRADERAGAEVGLNKSVVDTNDRPTLVVGAAILGGLIGLGLLLFLARNDRRVHALDGLMTSDDHAQFEVLGTSQRGQLGTKTANIIRARALASATSDVDLVYLDGGNARRLSHDDELRSADGSSVVRLHDVDASDGGAHLDRLCPAVIVLDLDTAQKSGVSELLRDLELVDKPILGVVLFEPSRRQPAATGVA